MKLIIGDVAHELSGTVGAFVFESEEELDRTIKNLQHMKEQDKPVRAYVVGEDPAEMEKVVEKVQTMFNRDQHKIAFDQDADIKNPADNED